MTRLVVTDLTDGTIHADTTDPARIATWLAGRNVRYEAHPARTASGDALANWADVVAQLRHREGYDTVDVVALTPEHPERDAIRAKFLAEHVHDDDEVRLFAEGGGGFYLRYEDVVATVSCGPGDLLSVPAGQRHWFDTGLTPSFRAIRFFRIPDGWVARFTGDDVARRFPAWSP